jgi:hypothetical protein
MTLLVLNLQASEPWRGLGSGLSSGQVGVCADAGVARAGR